MQVSGRFRTLLVVGAVSVGTVGLVARAEAQQLEERYPATVTSVLSGDTVDAQVAGGRALRVRLAGIRAPAAGRCGSEQAAAYLQQLTLGRNVTLVSEPLQGPLDDMGHSLFYIERDDGVDAGREMIRAGWAETYVPNERGLSRSGDYQDAASEADINDAGVWRRCFGDFQLSPASELRQRLELSAQRFIRLYYRRLRERQFVGARGMLARRVRRQLGPFASWRAGYRHSLGIWVYSANAHLKGGLAVVVVRIGTRDRDACSHRVERQYFWGRWILAPRGDSWVAVQGRIRGATASRVRLYKSECGRPRPFRSPRRGPSERPRNCHPSYPTVCIPLPPPDWDCDDLPFNDFEVIGRDPHGLDGNNDRRGCESERAA